MVTGISLFLCMEMAVSAVKRGPSKTTPPATVAAPTDPPLATVAEIPVGSGRVFEAERVVLVRPAQDEILGYSSVCTRAACVLTVLSADRLQCPCHRSVFDTADGSVLRGPGPLALSRG